MSSLNQNQLLAARAKVPSPNNVDYVRHEDGDTQDIINAILYADKYKDYMNAKDMSVVASRLRTSDHMQTLYNVWYFVRHNIEYQADKVGDERIKDAKVLWAMRVGDCKSFSLMIGSILRNYKDIGFSYRFVGYKPSILRAADYTHVYVIAHIPGRKNPVILDSTIKDFDYEVPFLINKDYSMTKIVHMTGVSAPNYNRGAVPTRAERLADAPRRAIRVPDIKNIPRLTEGQLSLNLLLQSLEIDEAYYGKSKAINEGKLLIQRALQTGSNAITGYVDTPLGVEIAGMVASAGKKLYAAIDPARMFTRNGINDPFTKEYCEQTFPYDAKKICLKRGFLGFGCTNWGPDPNDAAYRKYIDCIHEKNAYHNIFNQPNYINGAHHMLYAFEARETVPPAVVSKKIFHDFAINDWSSLSGLSVENVRLVTANGIKQTSASRKLPDITPSGSINYISEAHNFSDPSIPKIGVVGVDDIAIIVSIIIAAGGFILKCIDQNSINRARLQTNLGNKSFGPSEKDWIDKLNTENNYLLLGAAVLGGGLFLWPSSNKKS